MFSQMYYFSGTGNSLAAARVINEKSTDKSKIIPIPSIEGIPVIRADKVGIIFPVYVHKAPDIVKRFILSMEFTSSPYLYAVATHNGEPGQSLFEVQNLLTKKGQSLSLGIAIAMPGNCLVTEPDVELKRLSALDQKAAEIADLIENQKEGIPDGNNGLIEKTRNQIVGFFAWNYVFSAKRFKVTDNCTGCGTCEKLCPISNIHLVNRKPVWKKDCVACLACFHWCHKEAIYMNNSYVEKRRKYHHPDITITDMFYTKDNPLICGNGKSGKKIVK